MRYNLKPCPFANGTQLLEAKQTAGTGRINAQHIKGLHPNQFTNVRKCLLRRHFNESVELLANADRNAGCLTNLTEGILFIRLQKAFGILRMEGFHTLQNANSLGDSPGTIRVDSDCQIITKLPSDFTEQIHITLVIAANL